MFIYTIEHVFLLIIILLAILVIIYEVIKFYFRKIFMKNCRNCKHTELVDVSPFWMKKKCTKTGEIFYLKDINNRNRYRFCRKYEN